MEVSPSNISTYDDEDKALQCLLETFGSLFSLEEIASAYCKAGRNADFARQILYGMQQSTSTSSSKTSNGEARHEQSFESSYGDLSKKSYHSNGKLKMAKQKWRPVSGGTVSSFLGKDYVKSMPVANGSSMATKPLKLDANELPMSELCGEEVKPNPSKNDRMHKDMEDFLFKMLGDGFQLDRDVIQQVLEKCGYDMKKSMEKLLDLSVVKLDERNKCASKYTAKGTGSCQKFGGPSRQKELQPMNFYKNSNTNEGELPGQRKGRNDLQKEVLAALFNSADRSEELSGRRAKDTKRSLIYGEVVTEPPREVTIKHKADSVDSQQDNDNNEDEDENEDDAYQLLRRAVKEYRGTMKEYYKAAVDAFAKGEYDRANKLMDQGHFFNKKARDADEESSQKIFETKNVETQDEILLDLHDHGAKEAIRLLKCHLSSLSGILSFNYLRVIIETDEEDVTKGARRRLVMKLLEKESIKWTEGGNAGTILIHLDNINPKRLSFAKK